MTDQTQTTIQAILQRRADRLGISIEQLLAVDRTAAHESLDADLEADLQRDCEIDQMIRDKRP
jgi:hypothetical protein